MSRMTQYAVRRSIGGTFDYVSVWVRRFVGLGFSLDNVRETFCVQKRDERPGRYLLPQLRDRDVHVANERPRSGLRGRSFIPGRTSDVLAGGTVQFRRGQGGSDGRKPFACDSRGFIYTRSPEGLGNPATLRWSVDHERPSAPD